MLPVATILHPTDFSESSEFAFRLACALARDYNARLVLLHVALPPIMVYGESVIALEPGAELDKAKKNLHELEAHAGHLRVESQVMEGDPVNMILRAAEETHSDVIVMGTHGRTALARLLLGSVAEAVLRKAPCPVLTAKAPARLKPTVEERETKQEAGVAAE